MRVPAAFPDEAAPTVTLLSPYREADGRPAQLLDDQLPCVWRRAQR